MSNAQDGAGRVVHEHLDEDSERQLVQRIEVLLKGQLSKRILPKSELNDLARELLVAVGAARQQPSKNNEN